MEKNSRRTMKESFAGMRKVLAEERYKLEIPPGWGFPLLAEDS